MSEEDKPVEYAGDEHNPELTVEQLPSQDPEAGPVEQDGESA